MGRHSSGFPRLLAAAVLLGLCLALLGCGSDSGSADPSPAEAARQEREAARDAREERESQAMKKELEAGDYISCGEQVFVNKASLCTFAKNIQSAYYTEVQVGWGKPLGLEPKAEKDFRVLCSGTVPHKCTTFKDDGRGIEPLPDKSAVFFFSP